MSSRSCSNQLSTEIGFRRQSDAIFTEQTNNTFTPRVSEFSNHMPLVKIAILDICFCPRSRP